MLEIRLDISDLKPYVLGKMIDYYSMNAFRYKIQEDANIYLRNHLFISRVWTIENAERLVRIFDRDPHNCFFS